MFYSYYFLCLCRLSVKKLFVLTAERSVKSEEVRLLETQGCKKKNNNQQEGLQQFQKLNPSVLVEIVSHAVCNVKENKVLQKSCGLSIAIIYSHKKIKKSIF